MLKYVRKTISSFIIFMITLLVGAQFAFAGSAAAGDYFPVDKLIIEKYEVVVKKVEVAKNSYQNEDAWVTLGEGTKTFDLANLLDKGTSNYITNTSLDAGTYNYVRLTIDKGIKVKGYADISDTSISDVGTLSKDTYFTTASGNLVAATDSYGSAPPFSGSAYSYGADTFTIPNLKDHDITTKGGQLYYDENNDVRLVQDLSRFGSNPIEVSADGSVNMKIFFTINDSNDPEWTPGSEDPSLRFIDNSNKSTDCEFYISTPTVVVLPED